MKALLTPAAAILLGLALTGCSSTNDRGVTVNKPFDLFSVQPATPANHASAEVAPPAQATLPPANS